MNKDELPELPVAEAWRVKGHYTEIFVDFGEAHKYALAIGAKVEPLIVRDECREYALAVMQAGEPDNWLAKEWQRRYEGQVVLVNGANLLNEKYSDVLRELCSWLGAGGFNSEGLMSPEIAEQKIRWGVDHIVEVEKERAMPAGEPVHFVKRTDESEWLETNADTARAMVSGKYRDGIKFEQRVLYTRPPAMQAGEPVAMRWPDGRGHFTYNDMNSTVTPEAIDTAEMLYLRSPATSEAEAMLAFVLEHGLPEKYMGQKFSGFTYLTDGGSPDPSLARPTRRDAIRAAMKGAGS